jgi:hypothetical protein
VKTLLTKKRAPKGWQHFTVHAITHHPETASGYEGIVAAEMAGAKVGEESGRWGWNPLRDHVAKTTARPEVSLIALVCAGYEKTIARDSWRSPSKRHTDYLAELVAWGYILRNTGPRQQFPVISLPYFAGLSVSSKSSALGHADRGTMPDGQSSKNWTFRRWR